VVRNLARMEFDLGQHDRAQQLLEDALAAQIRVLGEEHPDLAPTRLARGRLLAQRGKLAEAAAEIDRAIVVLLASLGSEHPVVARARTTRAQTALAQGDYATALNQVVAAARSMVVFSQRTFGAISDRQRALLSQDSHKVIGALLSIPDVDARDLFVALLPHRDSVLRSIAARRTSERGDPRFATELDELRKRYVAAVLGRGPDTAQRVKSLAQAIEGLEVLQSAQGATRSSTDPTDVLKNACKRLPSDAALVKFVAYDRTPLGKPFETAPAYAALVVRGDGCRVSRVDLGDGAELQKFAEEFARAMRDQRMDQPVARVELSRVVLEPLKAPLEGVKRWLVVPDGSLWGIPIGVLPDPEDPNRYLLERVTVGYLTSTYELAEAALDRGPSETLERSLLVGAPDFGGEESGGPVVLTATGPCQLRPFEDLPATRRELDDISQLLSEPQLLVGADATKEQLEQALENQPRLVHFATHAYFAGNSGCDQPTDRGGLRERPISPNPLLLSGIVLAGANRPTRVDAEGESGILTAYEVAGLDLRSAGLVVLSACDTGTGLALRGQEIQGLRWGFRAAGARALVTSLWRSNDAATRRMMKSFYESLLSAELETDALRGAEALRRAKLEQLASETRLGIRRPLIWANFIFSGVL
jgi:CHAT domain-containing protein